MVRKTVHVAVCVDFRENLEKLYPNISGVRKKTERLNEILEELLYGTKKTK